MKKGSITVFSALVFMLIASFLFSLLEAGRVYQLDCYADLCSELAIESVCAEYQPELWDAYHILSLDSAYGSGEFDIDYVTAVLGERIRKNLIADGAGARIMEMQLEMAIPENYQLLTDGDGAVFLSYISEYMKENLPMEAARKIYEHYCQAQNIEENQTTGSVEEAQNAIEEAKRQQQSKEDEDAALGESEQEIADTEETQVKENPIEVVLALKQNMLLGMVINDLGGISAREISKTECLESRNLQKGTMQQLQDIDWYEKVLVLEYLDKYFASYLEPSSDQALSYELEYVLCGKNTDKGNLEETIGRLLLAREAANVTHILTDVQKRSMAMEMATGLAGFSGNPAIIKVVEIGIVAAWAYVESILDVRALLLGNRVELLKSQEQWVTQLGSLLTAFQGGAAKNCEDGLSYQDYLKGFLFAVNSRKLAYRMMDVVEQNIRLLPAYRNCRMDHMLCKIEYRMDYSAAPLFSDFSTLQNHSFSGFHFQNKKSFSYY